MKVNRFEIINQKTCNLHMGVDISEMKIVETRYLMEEASLNVCHMDKRCKLNELSRNLELIGIE
jgi:hypothetical protein